MPLNRILIILSAFVLIALVVGILTLNNEKCTSIGTMVSAAGSLLAVIWFSGSLWYQSKQLNEQRIQFTHEFKQLKEEGRRNALLLAKDILETAERKSLSLNPEMKTLSELPTVYMNMGELKTISESSDPSKVLEALTSWGKKEGPAVTLMKGLKSAAEVYFKAIGKDDFDFSKEPEEFVYIYGSWLWPLPYFESFQYTGTVLSEFMTILTPGRKAVIIASKAALAKVSGGEFVKLDLIKKDIADHAAKGYPLPKIAQNL